MTIDERINALINDMVVGGILKHHSDVGLTAVAVVIRHQMSAAIRAAVAAERETLENHFLAMADSCARSDAPAQEKTWRRAAEIIRARGPASGVPPAADKQAESGK